MTPTIKVHHKFPFLPYKSSHDLCNHALFSLPSLVALSKSLDSNAVEYNPGNLAIGHAPESTPSNGLSVEDTIESIENNGSWMVLKRVEQDPRYKALLDHTLSGILSQCDSTALGKCDTYRAFIFISSPHSVTPFHADPEHNFLLQIRGHKIMHQWGVDDTSILPKEALEKTYFGEYAHRNLPYQDSFQDKALAFNLTPGDCLHVPLNAPHWVKNGDEVSISFSITWQSDYSRKKHKLFYLNGMLRDAGLTKKSIGEHKLRDSLLLFAGYKGVGLINKLFG